MATTTTTVRTSPTLRRRESIRPNINGKRGTSIESTIEVTTKKRRLNEPHVRDSEYILRKHKGKPPSLTIHLHLNHFRFDAQDGSFAYDSPMRVVLKHLRLGTVPHDMLEELLACGVPFYDGCLIVEVHNHRALESKSQTSGSFRKVDDTRKSSMHTWNQHITPSPFGPHPTKAQLESDAQAGERVDGDDTGAEKQNGSEKEGPIVSTVVLHPTEQTKHEELLILAKTPAADIKKKKGDVNVPQTPVPTTPSTARGSQKMALDQSDLYSFHADMLVATEPPLILAPPENAEHALDALDMLKHPLHSANPPAPKERKRTTAEMAADDAQAAETERRLLIMDERMKPSARTGTGAAAGENQAAAASLGFSRFKTIELVRQKLEEAARVKKAADETAAQEKRQHEEMLAAQQKQAAAQQQQQHQQQQQQQQQKVLAEQRRRQLLQQQAAQQAAQHQQLQAAQQQSQQISAQQAMLQNNQHNNAMQYPVSASQASPVVAQQTPLMSHSSPMIPQNGFPMAATSSQQAGSPPRPASAMQQNPATMARVQSQQQHMSHGGTPHVTQGGTPSLASAVPNRNMSQTPRMGPSSPMVGTPSNMSMPTPRMNGNLSTTQDIMLQQMQNSQLTNGMQGQQNGNQVNGGSAMSPEQIQHARNMSKINEMARQAQHAAQQASQQGNALLANQLMSKAQQLQARYNLMRQQLLNGGHAVGNQQQTQMMNHGHPASNGGQQQGQQQALLAQQQQQHMAAQQSAALRAQHHQQQQQLIARRNAELKQVMQQNGGQIPPNMMPSLTPEQQLAYKQHQAQQAARMQSQAQAQARSQMQARMNAQMGVQHSPQANAQNGYLQNMQAVRNGLAMQMQGQQAQQNGGNNMNAMAMNMNMNMQALAQQQRQQQAQQQQQQQHQQHQHQQNGAGDLSQSFAAMQNALSRGQGMH